MLLRLDASGGGDHPGSLVDLGAPVLVLGLHSARYPNAPDFYALPNLNAAGQVTDIAELELNPAHTAIRVMSIVTLGTPRPGDQIAREDSATAVAVVRQQRGVAMRAGTQPVLVYLSIDAGLLETGQVKWTAGGLAPMDPMWLVHGADGHDYCLGNDGKVYAVAQMPGAPFLPAGR